MNVEQLIKGGHTIIRRKQKAYVPFVSTAVNVGNDATMTKPTMFLVEQGSTIAKTQQSIMGLKMNVNNATVAQNIVLQARDEFNF